MVSCSKRGSQFCEKEDIQADPLLPTIALIDGYRFATRLTAPVGPFSRTPFHIAEALSIFAADSLEEKTTSISSTLRIRSAQDFSPDIRPSALKDHFQPDGPISRASTQTHRSGQTTSRMVVLLGERSFRNVTSATSRWSPPKFESRDTATSTKRLFNALERAKKACPKATKSADSNSGSVTIIKISAAPSVSCCAPRQSRDCVRGC